MGVKSLFSNAAYNFLVVSELHRFCCKAESKLQRLRAIHNRPGGFMTMRGLEPLMSIKIHIFALSSDGP